MQSHLIDTKANLLSCLRYLELDLMWAGMMSRPSDYPWSSYHHNTLGRPDDLVTPHLECW